MKEYPEGAKFELIKDSINFSKGEIFIKTGSSMQPENGVRPIQLTENNFEEWFKEIPQRLIKIEISSNGNSKKFEINTYTSIEHIKSVMIDYYDQKK